MAWGRSIFHYILSFCFILITNLDYLFIYTNHSASAAFLGTWQGNAKCRQELLSKRSCFPQAQGCQNYGCVEAPTFCLFCQLTCVNAMWCSQWGGCIGGLLRTSLVSELFYFMRSVLFDGVCEEHSATQGLFCPFGAVAEHMVLQGSCVVAAGQWCDSFCICHLAPAAGQVHREAMEEEAMSPCVSSLLCCSLPGSWSVLLAWGWIVVITWFSPRYFWIALTRSNRTIVNLKKINPSIPSLYFLRIFY